METITEWIRKKQERKVAMKEVTMKEVTTITGNLKIHGAYNV